MVILSNYRFFLFCYCIVFSFSGGDEKSVQNYAIDKKLYSHGAIIRGDTTKKEIALVFTGDEFEDGGEFIFKSLKDQRLKASFFLTGNFYRNRGFAKIIEQIKENGNYLGSHSDKHLLYCDWTRRDSLLVTREEFSRDLENSFSEIEKFGIKKSDARYFLPPFEWYNDTISAWTRQTGLEIVNFTPGTLSNADYTYPEMGKTYVDSRSVYNSIVKFEERSVSGLNGFILLVHIGTDPRRTDKFYFLLPELTSHLKKKGYRFVRIDELLMGI